MRRSRLSAGTWLALSVGVLAVATLVAVGAALLASHHLTEARNRVVDRVDIATNTALVLTNAMVNQETGVRGFVLGGQEPFLDPYRLGVADAARAQRQLQTLAQAEMGGRLPGDLAAARRAIDAWQSGYARPTIERIRRFGAGRIEDTAVAAGKARFDVVRATLGRMQADLRADRVDARADLSSAAASLTRALVFAAILLALALLAIAIIGRQVIAVPIARLARQTRAVASGELQRVIEPSGPSDIERLGRDVESMRERIVRDLAAVRAAEEEIQAKAVALERSNTELEQFAYVASHDLQEPLRKVDELLPDARAAILGTARRARRAVHRLRGRRRQAHAGADQRPAGLLAGRARRAPARARRPRRARRACDQRPLARHRGDGRHRRGARRPAGRSTASARCSGSCSRT